MHSQPRAAVLGHSRRRRTAPLFSLLCALLSTSACTASVADSVELILPKHRLHAGELALIVNDADPLSVRIADYYRRARDIPAANVLHLHFPPARTQLSEREFRRLRATLEQNTPDYIQAYAITWARPYRVGCMSITAAITFGFDTAWCSSRRCAATRPNPYFAKTSAAPWTHYGIRPTMAIAATSFEHAKALIDRGVNSDNTLPAGTAYLLSTSDRARNVRATHYPSLAQRMQDWIATEIVDSDGLEDKADVLFYFTGTLRVPGLETLRFVPGAVADHLTSAGGRLTDSRQMSALRWLEAGATGSYGTVVEPCNLLGKFPHPALLMESYGAGRTLLEAYWQSVKQPGEGIFVGEPLAAPFDGYRVDSGATRLELTTRVLQPGLYRLAYANHPVGPFHTAPGVLKVGYHQQHFALPRPEGANYIRLQRR